MGDEVMTIAYRCTCGEPLRAQDELAGSQVKCPACEQMHTVPTAARRGKKRAAEQARGGWPRSLVWFLGGAGVAALALIVVALIWILRDRGTGSGDPTAEPPPGLPPAQNIQAAPAQNKKGAANALPVNLNLPGQNVVPPKQGEKPPPVPA